MPRPSSRTVHEPSEFKRHLAALRVAGQHLVDGVVDDLVDHVVQARTVVGVADVHARTLAHRVEPLQHLDAVLAVVFGQGFSWRAGRSSVDISRGVEIVVTIYSTNGAGKRLKSA